MERLVGLPLPALAAVLLVAGAALAGCAGAGDGEGDGLRLGDGSTVSLTANPTGGKGAIAGVVVDEAIRPIPGANVTVPSDGLTAEVDEGGVFVLDGLEPGLYILDVGAPGYQRVQTTADVVAGETAQVRVLLPRDDSPVPYRTTYAFDGFMQAWGGIGQFFVEEAVEGGTEACSCRVYFTPEANATEMVYEAYWEYSLADPGGLAEFYWVVEEEQADGYASGYCFSPCVETIDYAGNGFVAGTEAYARLDGPDLWVAFQQRFQLFVTVWHNGEAPDGWTVASS